jgi:hypothetical protein
VCTCKYKQLYEPHQIKVLSFYFYQKVLKAAAPCITCSRPRVAVFDEFHRTISPVESATVTLPYRTLSNQKQ